MPRSSEPGLVLSGLDGGNPLGFLAAVGTLNAVSVADSDPAWRMKWSPQDGSWYPALVANRVVSGEELVELLASALQREATPEFDFDRNLNVDAEKFRKVAQDAQSCASSRDRRYADFVTAFGCEVVVTRDGKSIQDTELRTMSSAAGRFRISLRYDETAIRQGYHARRSTERKPSERTLFETIGITQTEDYSFDGTQSKTRRYALRWRDPSNIDGSGSGEAP